MAFSIYLRFQWRHLLLFIVLFHTVSVINGHGHSHKHSHSHSHSHSHHSHDHLDEKPSFKYSKEANDLPSEDSLKARDQSSDAKHEEHSRADGSKMNMDEPRTHSKFRTKRPNGSSLELWIYGIGSTILISIAPFVLLWFIPVDNTAEYEPLLKIFLSFASGGLLGDAFLHLIPHAIMAKEEEMYDHQGDEETHTHDLSVGLWVLGGIGAFLIVEKFVRLVKGSAHSHSHHHPHNEKTSAQKTVTEKSDAGVTKRNVKKKEDENQMAGDAPRKTSAVKKEPEIKAAAYLNLAADFIHNFTDGLAIGASYLAGKEVGFVTTLTVFFHEVPHELGDIAILIQSGYSKRKAMLLQLVTALGAISGASCGLLAEGFGEAATAWILPFTAGGFIYLATVSVIPELLHDTNMKQSIGEIIGLMIGIGFMVGIALYE